MKKRHLLAKKLKQFYEDVEAKRTGKMQLQTDLEFNQNTIKSLNKQFNVEMFHSRVRGWGRVGEWGGGSICCRTRNSRV